MKLKEMKWVKWVLGTVGAVVAGGAIMLGGVLIGYPAISQLVGLAVAQSSTLWNNVIDAAKGDSQSSGILGMSPYLWNGLSFDRVRGDITNGMDVDVTRISGSVTPADGFANPTTANTMWNLLAGFNGATWDRLRTASATNNTATTSLGVLQTVPLSTWSLNNSASAGTPTISKASGGGAVRHVATSVTVCVAAAGTAQPAVQVNLRDGATGAGTIIRSWNLAAPINSSACGEIAGLNIAGTAATAMTIEFAAATAAATVASVSMSGYSTP
jgi:hypothetical protein